MLPSDRKILTWHPSGKCGVYMPREDYERVSDFIMSVLKANELTMKDLLDKAEEKLSHDVHNIAWNILIVKLDLEARGLIGTILKNAAHRSPFLRLRPGAFKKYRLHFDNPGLTRISS